MKNTERPAQQKSVEKLVGLLESNKELRQAVEVSIREAGQTGIETLGDFYRFLDDMLTHIPTDEELMPSVRQFYYLLGKSDALRKSEAFNKWMQDFVLSRGDFLDTPASAGRLDTFIRNPEYRINDYIVGPSGWLTFNQFLARQLKPGKRPVAGRCDDSVVVSPVDGEFMGCWPIDGNATINVKDVVYSVAELLQDSAYGQHFNGGQFSHIFLSVTDYHHYHVPVSGTIVEVKNIPAKTWVNEAVKPDGSLQNIDDVGFQFTHTRGHIVIDSPIGLVVVMPVGMGHISSVNITVEEGSYLSKGEAFGFFAFGGSDIILLFQSDRMRFTAKKREHYDQGQQIGMGVSR